MMHMHHVFPVTYYIADMRNRDRVSMFGWRLRFDSDEFHQRVNDFHDIFLKQLRANRSSRITQHVIIIVTRLNVKPAERTLFRKRKTIPRIS